MRPQSLIAIKSSPANGFDMAACRPWAIRPALPGPRTRDESKSFDPSGRGASQHTGPRSREVSRPQLPLPPGCSARLSPCH